MELRIFTEPQQGATYDDLLAVARTAEELGFGAFFRSDHYLGMGTEGLPGPSDAWVTLAGGSPTLRPRARHSLDRSRAQWGARAASSPASPGRHQPRFGTAGSQGLSADRRQRQTRRKSATQSFEANARGSLRRHAGRAATRT